MAVSLRVHPRHRLVASVAVEETIVVGKEVGVFAFEDERHHLVDEVAIAREALLTSHELGILLQAPHRPEQGVGLFHLVELHRNVASSHKVVESFGGRVHIFFKLFRFSDGQCETRHSDEGVACTCFEPRVACHEIFLSAELLAELVSSIHQTVVERVAGVVIDNLAFDERFQGFGVARSERSGENDAFPLFDGHFKIARHEEVFRFSVTAFALFGIVETAVPVGAVHIVGLWRVHLHKEVGISLIEFHADALFHWFCVRIGASVFVRPLSHRAESQIRVQSERGGRVRFEEGVADEETVALGAEDDFLFEEHPADAINPRGDFVPFKTEDIFVSLRTVVFACKFV